MSIPRSLRPHYDAVLNPWESSGMLTLLSNYHLLHSHLMWLASPDHSKHNEKYSGVSLLCKTIGQKKPNNIIISMGLWPCKASNADEL